MLTIRCLNADDHAAYRAIRLRALHEEPSAFSAHADDESAIPLAAFAERLRDDPARFLLGAFEDDVLIGIVGVTRERGAKEQHKAFLRSMYATGAYCGRGIGRQLLVAALAIADAMPGLRQVTLTVTAGNHGAMALYEAHGFRTFGCAPDALCLEGTYHDEWLMVRDVSAAAVSPSQA